MKNMLIVSFDKIWIFATICLSELPYRCFDFSEKMVSLFIRWNNFAEPSAIPCYYGEMERKSLKISVLGINFNF